MWTTRGGGRQRGMESVGGRIIVDKNIDINQR